MNMNIEQAMELEEQRANENSFYDVFEKHTVDEMIEYKKQAGIPLVDGE